MAKKSKQNSVTRAMARGAGARGTSAVPNSGREAYDKARKSTKGHYRVEFTQVYENMTEKDVELRKVYGVDLVAGNLGVPVDMVTLQTKKKTEQTLTALDEVFYVKVGQDVCGKLSIRTQRLWKGSILIFVFQLKKTALKPPQKAFSRKRGYKKRTASQKSQASRDSYNKRRGGTK
ncbi:hypothetical protein BSP12_157 [Bacillus phage BSP12]|nr:hypothetical protein BSP12_157 [Bacillus phage BSP12]